MLQRDKVAVGALVSNSGCDAVQILMISLFVVGPMDIGLSIGMLMGGAVSSVGICVVLYPSLLTRKKLWLASARCMGSTYGILTVVSRFEWPLFAAAAALIGALSTSVIFGLQTFIFIPLLTKIGMSADGNSRWDRMGSTRYLWVGVAFIGMVLSLLGQHQEPDATQTDGLRIAAGIFLAVLTVGSTSLSAARFPLGVKLLQELRLPTKHTRTELAAIIYIHALGCVLAASVLGVVGGITSFRSLCLGAFIGVVAYTPGLTTHTIGCLWATNLSLNAISYGTPLVTLALFGLVGRTTGVNVRLIALGAICVAVSNLTLFGSLRESSAINDRPGSAAP